MNLRPSLLVQWMLVCLSALFLSGCVGKGPKFDIRGAGTETGLLPVEFTPLTNSYSIKPEWLSPSTDFYRIGPSDVLDITVEGDKESNSEVVVGPDGRIYVGLLPSVFVWGLTLRDAEKVLQKQFLIFQKTEPDVSVSLKTPSFNRYWVMGSVVEPGVFPLATPTSLLEAIAKARGLMAQTGTREPMVDLKNSFVMRAGQKLPVDLERLFIEGDLSQNIYLKPDDYVYIKSSVARQIYVLGAVGHPAVLPYSPDATLLSAITAAGGTIEYAYLGHVTVVRGSMNSPKYAIVDYGAIQKGKAKDVKLQPNDLVFVPFVPYKKVAEFVERIISQFAVAVAVNEGHHAVVRGFDPTQVVVPLNLPPPVVPRN